MDMFTIKIPNIFKRKAKERPYNALMTFLGRNPLWTPGNLRSLTEAGFQNCMTMFRCVTLLAKGAGGIPWQLFEKKKSKDGKRVELFEHSLLDTFERPNPRHGQSAFIEAITGFYYIAGNSYILGVGPDGEEKVGPKELFYLYPHVTAIIPGNNVQPIAGYRYSGHPGKPKDYEPEDVLQLKAFNPLDDYYGFSPLKAAAKGIDILNMALTWNMKLLQNDMRPPGAIKVEGTLDEEERKNLSKFLLESHAGYENAGLPMVLEGGQDWMPFSINPKDADWINSIKLTLRFCCVTLGIDPALLGDPEGRTYSNQKEARRGLYEDTILPYMDYLRDELNNWFTPKYGDNLFLDYNRDAIEALKEERTAVYDRQAKAWWRTINEKRISCGDDAHPSPEADKIWIPLNFIPLDGNGGKSEPGKKSDKTQSFWQRKEQKFRLWQHFVKRVNMKERVLIDSFERRLKQQAQTVKEAILKATTLPEINPEAIIDVEKESKEYLEKYKSRYYENFLHAGEAGYQAGEGKLMDLDEEVKQEEGFRIDPELRVKLEALITESGAKISKATLKKIADLVIEAKYENWTVEETAKQIHSKLSTLAVSRSRTIARTEVMKTENWGQLEGYNQSPYVERKGWLCSFVPDSRDSHQRADYEYSENPIPLDEPFVIGGTETQYPGGSGVAEEDINCLCSTYPEVREA